MRHALTLHALPLAAALLPLSPRYARLRVATDDAACRCAIRLFTPAATPLTLSPPPPLDLIDTPVAV